MSYIHATIIQKNVRRYLCNKTNIESLEIKKWKNIREKYKYVNILPKDILRRLYQKYRFSMINFHKEEISMQKYIGRIQNFPDYISENIVLYALKIKNIDCTWITESGDIYYYKHNPNDILNPLKKKGEVKCSQNGPTQLSPKSKWDTLFYIDAGDHLFGNIKIYMIDDIYEIIKSIKISKNQTIEEQSNQGRRPRSDLRILLEDYINDNNILFYGKISSLLY